MAEFPKEHGESQNKDCATLLHTLYGQNNVTKLPVMAHLTSNNQVGLDQVQNAHIMDHAQSPNNESVAGMTQVCDVAPITHREDWLDLISFAIFALCYFTTSDIFFNNILCVP